MAYHLFLKAHGSEHIMVMNEINILKIHCRDCNNIQIGTLCTDRTGIVQTIIVSSSVKCNNTDCWKIVALITIILTVETQKQTKQAIV